MSTSNQRKAEKLGMPFGTANGKLRKLLLFHMAGKLNMLSCYRCKSTIETVDDFSIEHTVAWFNAADPVSAFFDVEKIEFSHENCNVRAAIRPAPRHGSAYMYNKKGCRCAECLEYKQSEWSDYYRRNTDQVLARKRERYHNNRTLAQSG